MISTDELTPFINKIGDFIYYVKVHFGNYPDEFLKYYWNYNADYITQNYCGYPSQYDYLNIKIKQTYFIWKSRKEKENGKI